MRSVLKVLWRELRREEETLEYIRDRLGEESDAYERLLIRIGEIRRAIYQYEYEQEE